MEEGISSLYLRHFPPVGNSEPLLEKIFFSFGPKLLLDLAFGDASCGFQHC